MEIIRNHLLDSPAPTDTVVTIPASREMLAKRRWRGVARDGKEVGFDLDHTLADGDGVLREGLTFYVVAQDAEPVVEIALGTDPRTAAHRAWQIGNLHFPVEVTAEVIRVADDSAIRQMLEREGIAYTAAMAVFHPISAGHGHHHHD